MSTLRQALRRFIAAVPAVALVPWLAGCQSYPFTRALWQESELVKHCAPAYHPNLQLYQSTRPADILVEYDEMRERDDRIRRRAYYLHANRQRIEARRKPRFVRTDTAQGLSPIPVFQASVSATNIPPGAGVCATLSTNGFNFTVRSAAGVVSAFTLPAYEDSFTTAQRAALTPVTVVGDVVVGAVLVGSVLGLIWLAHGAPGVAE